jgi:hypothetical protein
MPGGWNETCTPRSVPSLRGARRGDESRRHSWIAPRAGAPSRRRVAVRRGGFMRWGRPRRWAIHTGPATSPPSRARRPANPVRRPGAKVKVSCAWWSGKRLGCSRRVCGSRDGMRPRRNRTRGDWHRAPWQQPP